MKNRIISIGKTAVNKFHNGGLKGMITGKEDLLCLGVIGTGTHSRNNLHPNFSFLPVKVVSVCARHVENASYYGSKLGASSFYDNYIEMMEKEKLDLLLCSISASEHPSVVHHALMRGIPLFIEKPVAASSVEIAELLKVVQNDIVMIGFQKRFVPNYQFIKEVIESNKYGRLNYLLLEFGVGAHPSGMNEFLLDIGIHFIDLLRYYLPDVQISDVKKVTSGNGRMNISVSFHSKMMTIGNLFLSSNFDWSNCHERVFAIFEKLNIEVQNLVDLKITPNSKTVLSVPLEKVVKKKIYKKIWYPNYISGSPENSSLAQSGFYHELNYFIHSVVKKGENKISNLRNAYETHLMLEEIVNV